MEFFEWNENYATGVHEIDRQHAHLFSLTNRLIKAVSDGVTPQVMENVLAELAEYVREHFSYEESVLKQAGYERLGEHRLQHERMRKRLDLYSAEVKSGGLTAQELIAFLKTWLTQHVLREDLRYALCLQRFLGMPA